MTLSKFELNIPEQILERAKEIAAEKDQSIESVLLDSLALLFGTLPDTSTKPEQLQTYTDEQLWAIVHQRLAWVQDTRIRELTELGTQGKLTNSEKNELQNLIDLVDHQMLLRSHALILLKRRGYDIEATLKPGA